MPKPQPPKKGKTLDDLRALHDRSVVIPNRITTAIAALAASGDAWAYEVDFLKLARPPLSPVDLAKYREQFADFWADLPSTNGKATARRVWFASKKDADGWKEDVGG